MQITGIIKEIAETREYGSNGFQKREFVVTTEADTKYPQHLLVECVQDKCALLDDYAEGEEVIVSINLRGNIWTDPQGQEVVFNSFQAWRIERAPLSSKSASEQYLEEQEAKAKEVPSDEEFDDVGEEEDDLPF